MYRRDLTIDVVIVSLKTTKLQRNTGIRLKRTILYSVCERVGFALSDVIKYYKGKFQSVVFSSEG